MRKTLDFDYKKLYNVGMMKERKERMKNDIYKNSILVGVWMSSNLLSKLDEIPGKNRSDKIRRLIEAAYQRKVKEQK